MVRIKKCIYGIMAAFLFSGSAFAQGEGEGATLVVKDKKVERLGDELRLNMRFVLDSIDLARSKTLVCTPVVVSGDSLRPLRQVIINGRDRHILYERLDREGSDAIELRRRNGEPQSVDYEVRLPYADWMEQSEVALVMDDCGCGWETLTSNRSTLFEIDLKPVVLNPMMVYVTPVAERVKARSMAGSAFLDFRVNRTEIDPEYRNNPAELAKIRRTIEAVKENKFASITGVVIKGYASPEGSYQSNARLAEGRAKALLEYVKKQYDFGDASLKVESVPEDWEGLEKAVEASDMANKVELLAIIRADEPADWDAREWKLKQLNGGAPYRVLLNEIYGGPVVGAGQPQIQRGVRDGGPDVSRRPGVEPERRHHGDSGEALRQGPWLSGESQRLPGEAAGRGGPGDARGRPEPGGIAAGHVDQ